MLRIQLPIYQERQDYIHVEVELIVKIRLLVSHQDLTWKTSQ